MEYNGDSIIHHHPKFVSRVLSSPVRIDYFPFEIIVRSHALTRPFVKEDRSMFRFTIYSLDNTVVNRIDTDVLAH